MVTQFQVDDITDRDTKSIRVRQHQHNELAKIRNLLRATGNTQASIADALDIYMNAENPEKELQSLKDKASEQVEEYLNEKSE